jgi:F0F1-type ATP synthase assembly protein I
MWADRRFGTDPWLTVTGSLVGIGGGMYLLIRQTGVIK